MEKLHRIFIVIIILSAIQNIGVTQVHPTFDLTIKNVEILSGFGADSLNLMRFNIYLIWTNANEPGVNTFEFGAAQYNITFNPALGNSSNLTVRKIGISGPGNLKPGNQPSTFRIAPFPGADGRPLLQADMNLPDPTRNDIILSLGEGTRTVQVELRTTAPEWPSVSPDLKFQVTPPNNTLISYFLPSKEMPDDQTLHQLLDTVANHYSSDSQSIIGRNPRFDMIIRNITTVPNPLTGADSLMRFDINLLWTNATAPNVNPFEFAAGQYNITFNPALGNDSNLAVSKIIVSGPGNLHPGNQPYSYRISPQPGEDGRTLLQIATGYPVTDRNDIILSTGNGTRVGRMQIRTTAHMWPFAYPDFRFQFQEPNSTFLIYYLPANDPKDPDLQNAMPLLDTINNHFYSVDNFPLPVELASFTSTVNKNVVVLTWSTSSETNNQSFDIERSLVGTNEWTKAGYVNGNGTTDESKNYKYSDRVQAPGKYLYRLKQIDFNGNFEYHNLNGEVIVGIPATYAISQNYPNPFNPSTKIDFDLPYDGKVSILLYDISGRGVGKLVNEVKTAGYYTVNFNASNLSSGMYFYRITAEGNGQNFVQTKKMMLIK